MGTNISTDYDAAVNVHGDDIEIDCKDEDLAEACVPWVLPKSMLRPTLC